MLEIDNNINDINVKISKNFNYSTNEEIIGVYIDGRTIYKKTFFVAGVLNFTDNRFRINHGISNFDMPIKLYGTLYDPVNGDWYGLPYVTTGTANIMLYVNSTTITVEQKPYGSGRLRDLNVTVEYVKTS